jgi:hypothetical protein
MPLSYVIDAKQQCVFIYLFGAIDDWGIGMGIQELWEDEDFDPHYNRFIDGREIRCLMTTPDLIQAVAKDVLSSRPRMVALIAASAATCKVFAQYEHTLTGISSRIFSGVTSAAAWLGVVLPDPWPPDPHLSK